MSVSRRGFLGAAAATAVQLSRVGAAAQEAKLSDERLERIASEDVLHLDGFPKPVVIDSMELLQNGSEYLVRVRSKDGAESVIVANSSRFRDVHPIFLNRVAPFFHGKDARKIESLLTGVYRHGSNYKWQGLAFWVSVAAAEMAILELLGRVGGKSVAGLFGGAKRRDIAVYRASGNRGNRPEDEVRYLRKIVESIGAKALKFRLGGRMSNNQDSRAGRTEALIPMVRREFGDDMTLYADSNSSYDVPNAIRIGRMMEEHKYAFFEEPVPFDHLWETKQVTDALTIPVAGGEQEFSMRRFRWAILNRAVDVVQPDLHYFGGFIRSTKVARMADAAKMPCTVHMSGAGLGYVYVLHFAAYVRDPGPHQEFKGASRIPIECKTSSLACEKGVIRVPSGPGFGVDIDPKFVAKAKRI